MKKADEFYASYPKKAPKGPVVEWFAGAALTEDQFGALMICLERSKTQPRWHQKAGQFVPLPVNWLSKRLWTERDVLEFIRRSDAKAMAEASDNDPATIRLDSSMLPKPKRMP